MSDESLYYRLANLTAEEKRKLEALEQEMGVVLIAYRKQKDPHDLKVLYR